jgi:hypothetical protein
MPRRHAERAKIAPDTPVLARFWKTCGLSRTPSSLTTPHSTSISRYGGERNDAPPPRTPRVRRRWKRRYDLEWPIWRNCSPHERRRVPCFGLRGRHAYVIDVLVAGPGWLKGSWVCSYFESATFSPRWERTSYRVTHIQHSTWTHGMSSPCLRQQTRSIWRAMDRHLRARPRFNIMRNR